jgi:hypothetical protein
LTHVATVPLRGPIDIIGIGVGLCGYWQALAPTTFTLPSGASLYVLLLDTSFNKTLTHDASRFANCLDNGMARANYLPGITPSPQHL